MYRTGIITNFIYFFYIYFWIFRLFDVELIFQLKLRQGRIYVPMVLPLWFLYLSLFIFISENPPIPYQSSLLYLWVDSNESYLLIRLASTGSIFSRFSNSPSISSSSDCSDPLVVDFTEISAFFSICWAGLTLGPPAALFCTEPLLFADNIKRE